jgi:hypothetical protein
MIDKNVSFCIINPTTLIRFSLPKGVVDGERPLKFELDITFSFRKLNLFLDRDPICINSILKAFQKKKI